MHLRLYNVRCRSSQQGLHFSLHNARYRSSELKACTSACTVHDADHQSVKLASQSVQCMMQIIRDNLATDGFMPPGQKAALNGAKQWLAQQWPHFFKLRPLTRLQFLAPTQGLSGADNNTSNPVHRRQRHGEQGRHVFQANCCVQWCNAVLWSVVGLALGKQCMMLYAMPYGIWNCNAMWSQQDVAQCWHSSDDVQPSAPI